MLNLAALLMALTGLLHSFFGERRLITPLLALDVPMLQKPQTRWVIRLAWHFTSLLMLLTAMTAWRAAQSPATADRPLLQTIGAAWLAGGLLDAIGSRGKHIGWPPITLAGLFTLIPML
jgi:hypothetical protein